MQKVYYFFIIYILHRKFEVFWKKKNFSKDKKRRYIKVDSFSSILLAKFYFQFDK